MKNLVRFLVLVTVAVVSIVSVSFAGDRVSSTTITMTATVQANIATAVFEVRDVSPDALTADKIWALGTVSGGGAAFSTKGKQYIKVTIDDNSAWSAVIYTNNFPGVSVATATWGFSYGGLIGSKAGNKIPLAWHASTFTVVGGAAVGHPKSDTSGWMYVKDFNDVTDPTQPGKPTDFVGATNAGFTTFAFGTGAYTTIVSPLDGAGGNNTRAVGARTDPFYIYTEVDLSVATADSYTGKLVLDVTNN